MSLARTVIWILAQDHYPHIGVAREAKRTEDIVVGWKHLVSRSLVLHELLQFVPVALLELLAQ
jgi:hypothetical protein